MKTFRERYVVTVSRPEELKVSKMKSMIRDGVTGTWPNLDVMVAKMGDSPLADELQSIAPRPWGQVIVEKKHDQT